MNILIEAFAGQFATSVADPDANSDRRIRTFLGLLDPDPLVRGMDPRILIRIHTKMSWIRNTVRNNTYLFLAKVALEDFENSTHLAKIRSYSAIAQIMEKSAFFPKAKKFSLTGKRDPTLLPFFPMRLLRTIPMR
jgi:hypothetical protein